MSTTLTIIIVIIIIIIIIRHQLGLYSPGSPSSNSLFKVLRNHLRAFALKFNIIFGILLLFILVTCCSRYDSCLRSFSLTGSTFNLSKISSFLFGQKKCISFCSSVKFHLDGCRSSFILSSYSTNYHFKFCRLKLCNKWRNTVNFPQMKFTNNLNSHSFALNMRSNIHIIVNRSTVYYVLSPTVMNQTPRH